MFSLTKQVFAKYWPLIVKMHEDESKNNATLKNLNSLCDVEFISSFHVSFKWISIQSRIWHLESSTLFYFCKWSSLRFWFNPWYPHGISLCPCHLVDSNDECCKVCFLMCLGHIGKAWIAMGSTRMGVAIQIPFKLLRK
jgi:hypothetical protein